MIINPTKSSLKLEFLKAKARNVIAEEKYRKEIPGIKDTFSEENFIPFEIIVNKSPLKLYTYREHGKNLQNLTKPSALLFLVHGLFAHVNRCAHLGKFFSNMGITTLGFDARGHGKSGGLPGYIANIDDLLADLDKFTQKIDEIYSSEIPRFLIGQSMGGMMGFMYGLKRPEYFKGMILLAPSLKQHDSQKFSMKAAKFLSYIVSKVPIPVPKKNSSSKNPAVFENSLIEPYIYKGGIRMGTIASLTDAMDFCSIRIENFKVPLLMIQGGMDNLVDVECNIDLVEKSVSKDKTLVFYENVWHDILHEEEIFEIFDYIAKWIESRINKKEQEIKF